MTQSPKTASGGVKMFQHVCQLLHPTDTMRVMPWRDNQSSSIVIAHSDEAERHIVARRMQLLTDMIP